MNKKVISAMLAASMAVSLAACGSTATSEATSAEASSAVSSETTSTVASGESAASGSYTGTPSRLAALAPSPALLQLTAMLLRTPKNWLSKRSTPQTAAMFLTGSSRTMSTMLKRALTLTTP